MSNTIYSIQEKLDSILDIKSIHTIPDAELFDLSDYPNGGKSHGYFSWLGMKLTEEHKNNISKGQIGNKRSDEHKVMLSKMRKGVPWKNAEERKKKLSERRTGRKHSEATKQKMREARLKNNPGSFKKGNINGKNKE
jgi:hypothetical protein